MRDDIGTEEDKTTHEKMGLIDSVLGGKTHTIAVHADSDDFFVIEVDGEWIFRFARNHYAGNLLKREKVLLPKLRTVLPLPIPFIQYSGPDWIGYRKIMGEMITAEVYQAFQEEEKKRCASQLGTFLTALHAFPVEEARIGGLTRQWSGWFPEGVQVFKTEVLPRFSETVQKNILAFFDTFMSYPFAETVTHGDLFLRHSFFDRRNKEISGIIDFGDATIGDPARDFQCILDSSDPGFLGLVLSSYQGREDPHLVDRVLMWNRLALLLDTPDIFDDGLMDKYERQLEEIETTFLLHTHNDRNAK